jgi:hypothetical protein
MTTAEDEGERTRDRVSLNWAATQNDLGRSNHLGGQQAFPMSAQDMYDLKD